MRTEMKNVSNEECLAVYSDSFSSRITEISFLIFVICDEAENLKKIKIENPKHEKQINGRLRLSPEAA